MKITITEYEKKYEFEIFSVAQLCGQNVIKKKYIFESLRKYFGTYKYSEKKNPWRDNVYIDDEQIGRKFFKVISIANRDDLIALVNLSKQSLFLSYLRYYIQNFECQKSMEVIDEELTRIIGRVNSDLQNFGNIELGYSQSEIWDIIQKTEIKGIEGQDIQELSSYELFEVLFGLLSKIIENEYSNYLVICENIDHLISKDEYSRLFAVMNDIAKQYSVHFLCSISLNGYPIVDDMHMRETGVINEYVFQFPEASRLVDFINENFPMYMEFSFEDIAYELKKIINKIGEKTYLSSQKSEVILKMINKSFSYNEVLETTQNQLLQSFLES